MRKTNDQTDTDKQTNNKKIALLMDAELLTRAISSVVLATVTLFLAYYSYETFAALSLMIMVLMIWEWGRLTNNDTPLQLLIQIIAMTLVIIAFMTKEWLFLISILIAAAFLLSWSTHYWWRSKWALFGFVYLLLPVLGLLVLRQDSSMGFLAVLFILLIVWATDIFAYFSGRYFGGEKLAPNISPNKTWAGFYGGVFAGLITGAIFAISINQNPIILSLIGVFLSILSQGGDLLESAIKRHFGVKDSSKLIPGHGGILDRLDGVITAVIGATLIVLFRHDQVSSHALLIW